MFDRKLHAFYDGAATLLEESLRDGQALGIVTQGDTRVFSYLTLGALKELLYQVVVRGWKHSTDEIVDEVFAFLRDGYLRVASMPDAVAASESTPKRASAS